MAWKRRWKKSLAGVLSAALLASSIFTGPAVTAQAEVADITTGLVGHWSFDDANQLTSNQVTDGKTMSIGGNGITASTEGILGGAANFDSTYTYLNIAEAFNAASDTVTISFWIKAAPELWSESAATGTHVILLQQNGTGRTFFRLNRDGRTYATYATGVDTTLAGAPVQNQWQHVSVVSKPETKTMEVYVDGALSSEKTLTGNYADAVTNLYIGAHKNDGTMDPYPYQGLLDEVRLYTRALTATDVKAIYDSEKGSETVDPVDPEVPESVENPAKIVVDSETVVKTLTTAMFGINHRYHFDGVSSWNPVTNAAFPEFDVIAKQSKYGSIRYPGGTVSNTFEWKRSIGAVENRIQTIHGAANYSQAEPITPNFGVDEAATYIIDELQSEMIYVYGVGRGSAKDAADLVEYLNAEVGADPNGDGVDWAKVRSDNGHPEPYNVTYFELGNEFTVYGQAYWTEGRASGSITNAYLYGGTMTFNNQQLVGIADWRTPMGKSDGTASQVRYTKYFPVTESTAVVKVGGTAWTRVDDITAAGAENVFEIDGATGKVTFGDGTHGNIPAADATLTISYSSEQDGVDEYLAAMKAVDPDIKIYTCTENDEVYNSDLDIDGIVIHPYAAPGSGPGFYEDALALVESFTVPKLKTAQEKLAVKHPNASIAASEFGLFRSSDALLKSQTNAMHAALSVLRMADLNVEYTNRHCLIDYPNGDVLGPGQQAVIQAIAKDDGSGEYDYVATPSTKLYELLADMTATKVLSDTVKNNPAFVSNLDAVQTLSTKDDNYIYVLAMNLLKEETQNVTVDINGKDLNGENIEIWTLAGDSFDAQNTVANPDNVVVEKATAVGNGRKLSYVLPAHSIVSFKIPLNLQDAATDKTELTAKYAELKDTENIGYTTGTWSAFATALATAETVLDNANATQTEIDNAFDDIEATFAALSTTEYTKLASTGMTASASSVYNGQPASNALDGDTETHWHSDWSEAGKAAINMSTDQNNDFTIDLGQTYRIGKFGYLPRQGTGSGAANGRILTYDLYYSTSESGDDFVKIALTDNVWANNASEKETVFTPVDARRIQLRAKTTVGDTATNKFISAAEFYVYQAISTITTNQVITFDPQGGELAEAERSREIAAGSPLGNLPNPTKADHTFAGWFTAAQNGSPVTADTVPNGSVTYYAQWTPVQANTYTITFEAEGGVASQNNKVIVAGETVGNLPTATRDGYSFVGWFTEREGGVKVLATRRPDGDVTYYARWDQDITYYRIDFNANGGTSSLTFKNIIAGQTVGELPTATQTGFTFNGWFTAATGGDKIVETTTPTGAVTYYAQWQQEQQVTPGPGPAPIVPVPVVPSVTTYTVTFDGNGGTASKASADINSGEAVGTLPTATRDGYEFTGWFTEATGGTQVTAETKVTAAMTVYAQWTEAPAGGGNQQIQITGVKTAGKSAIIKWNKVKKATGYQIFMKTGKGDYELVKEVAGSKTKYTIAGLKAGKNYQFRVTASTGKNAKKKVTYGKSVTMTWKNVSGYSSYDIMLKVGKGSYEKVKTVTKGGTVSYTVKSAKVGKKYTFQLIGVNS